MSARIPSTRAAAEGKITANQAAGRDPINASDPGDTADTSRMMVRPGVDGLRSRMSDDVRDRDAPALPRTTAAHMVERSPMDFFKADPRDQRLKDVQDLVDMNLVGHTKPFGARMFSDAQLDHLKDKQEKLADLAVYDVIAQAFDPSDATQRAKLEHIIPNYTDNRITVKDRVYQQQDFLSSKQITTQCNDYGEFVRVINILGGAEPLLIHPTQAYLGALMNGEAAVHNPDEMDNLFGLWSWSDRDAPSMAPDFLEKSRPARIELAKTLLPCFPAFAIGKLTRYAEGQWGISAQPASRVNRRAEDLVGMCEQACLERTDMRTFYKNYVDKYLHNRPTYGQKYSWGA